MNVITGVINFSLLTDILPVLILHTGTTSSTSGTCSV
jgi:hypothetical protein